MEENPVLTGADFAELLGRLRSEQPAGSVYLHTNIVTDRYYLLGEQKQLLAETDYDTAAFYTLAFRAQVAGSEGDDFYVVLALQDLEDTSGVRDAEFALELMKYISAPLPRKPRAKRGKK
ncbi:hypothetical protein [Hymenobacter volaticus]|uniref:Uncharacterized protein n=1 Tax=Hymenobacter volaticus TaxID=2932254 RepID=A0ABY4GFI0_9BACT|nr:hypothetical protein [Hymenobacter volaticus]UOQ69560.1 hypothetical protein MUN86_28380 [Hymenobacter volaticus]